MSRAKTKQEVVEEFLNHVKGMVNYWENEERRPTSRDKLEGLAFSFLVMLDGGSVGMPAFDLIPSPHPSDKEYHQEQGENWYEPEVINDNVQLHELYSRLGKT